jgi:hypothetical protein
MYIGWWFNPSEKYERTSVGMMKFPRYGKIKFMFQTTNQIYIYIYRMGPPRQLSCLISGLTMVYDRYNYT